MSKVNLFNRFKQKRASNETENNTNENVNRDKMEDLILKALRGEIKMDKDKCMEIPIVARSVNLIINTISNLKVRLYLKEKGNIKEIKDDKRLTLLNISTGDIYSPNLFRKAVVEDYLFYGVGRAYINRNLNNIESIHYVEHSHLSRMWNIDPIFKNYEIYVDGKRFFNFDFINVYRKMTEHGDGVGVIKENKMALGLLYTYLKFEQSLVSSGGNKRGFLKSSKKLSKEALNSLREAWKKLYGKDSEETVVVLNDGIDFKEASSTSVEMQMQENKDSNNSSMSSIFLIPSNLLNGNYDDKEYQAFLKIAILPILTDFESALNNSLLLETEKEKMFFSFSIDDLLKADILTRFQAYNLALTGNYLKIDEIREKENLEKLNLNWIKLGLQDVLYDPETKKVYTPNTNKISDIGSYNLNMKGGDKGKDDESSI